MHQDYAMDKQLDETPVVAEPALDRPIVETVAPKKTWQSKVRAHVNRQRMFNQSREAEGSWLKK